MTMKTRMDTKTARAEDDAENVDRIPIAEKRDRDLASAPVEVSAAELETEQEAAEDRVNPGRHDEDAYEDSDEALPDDEEEEAIADDPFREEKRFGDI